MATAGFEASPGGQADGDRAGLEASTGEEEEDLMMAIAGLEVTIEDDMLMMAIASWL